MTLRTRRWPLAFIAALVWAASPGAGTPSPVYAANSAPASPTSLAESDCFSGGCSGVAVVGSATPVITARVTDPDPGAVLRYDFELWAGLADVPSGSPLATASFPNLASGQTQSWTVPAGVVADAGRTSPACAPSTAPPSGRGAGGTASPST